MRTVRALVESGAAGGLVLIVAAALALAIANSPAGPHYFAVLRTDVLGLSVGHWVNDGLMAAFFLLVGLEIKREFLEGELASWPRRALPGVAALGGMIAPALVYLVLNLGEAGRPQGWAIPAATDIAFALGVLALLGPRVPASLKIFLTALAIIDDLGAVAIIAAFYTADIDVPALGGALLVLGTLALLNRSGHRRLWPFLALGAVLWFLVLRSGVHATLAGVALALTVPLRRHGQPGADPPLHRLEHALHRPVTYLVVPIFGFCNAGVSFQGVSLAQLAAPIPLGVTLGLVIGKQIGVFGAAYATIGMGLATLPRGAGWRDLYGVSLLCGIGFTMSLFVGLLAFPDSPDAQDAVKIGVLAGSLLSMAAGVLVLLPRSRVAPAVQ